MSEQPSRRTEAEDGSRVDDLLGLLGDLSQQSPSPALRERLGALAASRLSENPDDAARPVSKGRRTLSWLKPTFAAALLVTIGLTTVFVIHFRREEPAQANKTAKVNHPVASSEYRTPVAPAPRRLVAKQSRIHHSQPVSTPPFGARQMTMRLPYSNNAIQTGTDATFRVSMSQSELLSLGFPINATVPDRRIVAELTLGDDGLPRAISVPLPLEVMKEKQ